MKNRLYVWTILLFLFISVNGHAEDTIRITNGEWAPFYSENLKYYGLDSHIVTEAFALEGIRVTYGFYPWKLKTDFPEKTHPESLIIPDCSVKCRFTYCCQKKLNGTNR